MPPVDPGWFARMKQAASGLAAQNVFIGTSSWKYPGWRGWLYEEERYLTRGKFSNARFERHCLSEYAELFSTVCVDAGYYAFPTEKYIAGLSAQVPAGFRFSFKVTEDITMKHFPRLDRLGKRAGQGNPHFLDAGLFRDAFLAPLAPHREKIGVLIFEFARFHPGDWDRGRDFVDALDHFLGKLPPGWQYGVELRNETLLHPDTFAVLARHRVAHVYNNWTKMPPILDQLAIEGSRTTDFTAARFLLKPGRKYEEAVAQFSPYEKVQDPNPPARQAGAALLASLTNKTASPGARPTFIYVNNRLEGNALGTLTAMLEGARMV